MPRGSRPPRQQKHKPPAIVTFLLTAGVGGMLLRFHNLMDTIPNQRYHRGNLGGLDETSRYTPHIREAAASGHPFIETGPYVSLGGPRTERLVKLRGALASNLPEERPERAKTDAQYGTTLSFVRPTEESFGARLGERALGSRLFDGSLDIKTYRSDNPEELSSAVLYRCPVFSH